MFPSFKNKSISITSFVVDPITKAEASRIATENQNPKRRNLYKNRKIRKCNIYTCYKKKIRRKKKKIKGITRPEEERARTGHGAERRCIRDALTVLVMAS